MSPPTVGHLADNVTDVVGEVLVTGKDLATDAARHLPDVTESIGDIARSTASAVADLATTAIALAPFTSKATSRRRPWWLVVVALVGLVVVIAWWKRSRGSGADAEAEWNAASNVAPLTPSSSAATA
jgi:hypothetical protein